MYEYTSAFFEDIKTRLELCMATIGNILVDNVQTAVDNPDTWNDLNTTEVLLIILESWEQNADGSTGGNDNYITQQQFDNTIKKSQQLLFRYNV